MCPFKYYSLMRKSKDPKYLRLQIALYAKEQGIKATARAFNCSRNTVRKWYSRWLRDGYRGLESLSRRPHHSPNATPASERKKLVELKKKYKRLGADAIKVLEKLPQSPRTIRKIWREEGVSSRKRRKKHKTKQNLREVKRHWRLFQQIDEDTKYLNDIPEYYSQMMTKGLPKIQFTARDVTSGLIYLGFAEERSATNATLFARYLNKELSARGADLSGTVRQTDNGSEYISHVRAKKPSPYTLAIEEIDNQVHSTIPPRAHTFQSDVETVHNIIEIEFYELEHFKNLNDFMNKAFAYQIFFNLLRPNSYKENKTPWQLAKDKQPSISMDIALIPPVYLENLMEKELELSAMGGHDVPSNPWTVYKTQVSKNPRSQRKLAGQLSTTNAEPDGSVRERRVQTDTVR